MIFNKKLAVAVSGAVLLMAGQFALADSTTDIVDALVSKGVLTEEEGKLIAKGHVGEKKAQDKAIKGKLKINDALSSAELYGDVRVRYENRQATGDVGAGLAGHGTYDRFRGKFVLGIKMDSGNWYSDFALSTGAKGRSDNFTFASQSNGAGGLYGKTSDQAVNVNKLMVGWKATDWLTLEAGRMKNPFYTTPMMWDADLPIEGLSEQFKFKSGDTEYFATLGQITYQSSGMNTYYNGATADATSHNTYIAAESIGLKTKFEKADAKIAATIWTYLPSDCAAAAGGSNCLGNYKPTLINGTYSTAVRGVNDLNIIQIPAEVNFMVLDGIGMKVFGDYAYNMDGNDRATNAGLTALQGGTSGEKYAYTVGLGFGSTKDLSSFGKMKKGDWSVKGWYQEVGIWSLDPNTVDSDYMDGRVNTKGVVLKAQYNIEDNVLANLSAGYATRLNDSFVADGYGDMAFNWSHYSLIQTDLTWKF